MTVRWTGLIVFLLVVVARALGVPGLSFLVSLLSVILFFVIVTSRHELHNSKIPLVVSVFFLLGVAFLQYLLPLDNLPIIILLAWILFLTLYLKKILQSGFLLMVCLFVSFVLVTSALLNPRNFHNLFRPATYEAYIRSKYKESEGALADYYIDKYKSIDKTRSGKFLQEAIEADSCRDFKKALYLYDKSIDFNPDNAMAYHRRGFLKLNGPELDFDAAYSAVKDFNRAIQLDSTYTLAYYHRSVALGYLNRKGRSFLDRKKVWTTDSLIPEEEFIRRYGVSKKSFLIPSDS
jgi:tetratricopeptide (TPR) repeat protein